jgi:succinate-semialdehyde dehydrogenase/glutarate-semialdehyde dehydrogenase
VSERLISSPVVRKITFTGSVAVGRRLAALAGSHLKPCTLELGGHAPVLVFDDADVGRVAPALAKAKARNAGQVCVSPSRFYVQEKVYDLFVDLFSAAAKEIRIGPGLDPATQMGPLASPGRLKAAEEFVAEAEELGAGLQAGGRRLRGPLYDRGWFFQPTVLTDTPPQARILREEPFCPVAPIVRFRDFDEALEKANALPYGLASYVFTESLRTAHSASKALKAGLVGVNQISLSQAETPFGGVGDSGWGSEGGLEGLEEYLVTKFVSQA